MNWTDELPETTDVNKLLAREWAQHWDRAEGNFAVKMTTWAMQQSYGDMHSYYLSKAVTSVLCIELAPEHTDMEYRVMKQALNDSAMRHQWFNLRGSMRVALANGYSLDKFIREATP